MNPVEYPNCDPLGTAKFFINLKQPEKAKVSLDQIKPYCKTIEQLDAIGKLYADCREWDDSLEIAKQIHSLLSNNQSKYDIRTNIVRSLLNLNRPEEALIYINMNEKVNPSDHPNRMDKAMALFLLNRKTEGEAILRKILEEPHNDEIDARVKFNLGSYDMRNGNFKDGLKNFLLQGRKLSIWESYTLPKHNEWDGSIQPGKTVLLCQDGGIGDEIINIRFQKHIKQLGMNPVWFTARKDLAEVFRRNGFQVITNLDEYKSDWLWTYSMIVPVLLDVDEDDLWHGPYLKSIGKAEKLPGKLKIGIKCVGNPKYDQDLNRTIPYKEILEILPKDATVYSFHVEEDINDLRVIPLKGKIKTWDDTLDFIDQMDYMISSCTSTAHAASAMGKKTVVMVPILNYYLWAKPGNHSKWYSENTTLFRQTDHRNWNDPISELKDYLNGQ